MRDAPTRVRARADGRRGRALHPLHVGHDRQAEGHRAHHRRLPRRASRRPRSTCSTSRRTTSSGAPPTSAGSPGTSYLVYGPLANGATCVMYEGAPDWPEKDRFWEICERHGVTILYTAPTAIRAFMKWGDQWPAKHDLSRLRLLGSVGEPINPEAWMWYREHIGGKRCPIVDTWWQTETGAIVISPLPGRHRDEAGQRDACRCPATAPRCSTRRRTRSRWAAACSRSRGRGRRCCAPSGATTSATSTPTSRSGPAARTSTSPATAPSATTTATSGSSAAWTTC